MKRFIFRAYDIRGRAIRDFGAQEAFLVGKYGFSGIQNVIIGHDIRRSSKEIHAALMQGLYSVGKYVLDLGVCSSPMLYHASKEFNCCGIMITASHNIAKDNGLKIAYRHKRACRRDLISIYNMCLNQNTYINQRGTIRECNIMCSYVRTLKYRKHCKILWSAHNGCAKFALSRIVSRQDEFQCEQIDHFDPAKNIDEFSDEIVRSGYDLGFAFDGDADRLVVVNHEGAMLHVEDYMDLIVEYIHFKLKRDITIVIDVKISSFLKLKHCNITVSRTGHSYILNTMRKCNADIAIEASGHIYFKENMYDDGVYSAIQLVNAMRFHEISRIEKEHKFLLHEMRIQQRIDVNLLKYNLMQNGISWDEIDGIKVIYSHYWWLIRQSNTEDVVSVRAEGKTHEDLQIAISEIKRYSNVQIN